ncbi:MAG: hypothetical protein LBI69_04845 [Puniceicoccales bacterium]|jgi:hypothetical protein|nr:hypothetical protein [Puniceicoccales bacterium]
MAVKSDSGFRLNIGRSESNIFTLNFNFYDIAIENGSHFSVPQFLTINRFTMDFLLSSLVTKKITIEDLSLDIPSLTHVRNASGKSNIGEFLSETMTRKKSQAPSRKKSKEVFIRHFQCKIGKIITMDYGASPVKINEINLNYSVEMRDVSAEMLLRKLTSDLRTRGGFALIQSVLGAMVDVPCLEEAARAAMRANGIGQDGNSSKIIETGKGLWYRIKSAF